jgi:hypothetical protein
LLSTHECGKGEYFQIDIERMEAPAIFTWRWAPGIMESHGLDLAQEPTTVVTFSLEETLDGTVVHFTESGFEDVREAEERAVIGTTRRDGMISFLR